MSFRSTMPILWGCCWIRFYSFRLAFCCRFYGIRAAKKSLCRQVFSFPRPLSFLSCLTEERPISMTWWPIHWEHFWDISYTHCYFIASRAFKPRIPTASAPCRWASLGSLSFISVSAPLFSQHGKCNAKAESFWWALGFCVYCMCFSNSVFNCSLTRCSCVYVHVDYERRVQRTCIVSVNGRSCFRTEKLFVTVQQKKFSQTGKYWKNMDWNCRFACKK